MWLIALMVLSVIRVIGDCQKEVSGVAISGAWCQSIFLSVIVYCGFELLSFSWQQAAPEVH